MFRRLEGQVTRRSAWTVGISLVETARSVAQLYLTTNMLDVAQFGAFQLILTIGLVCQGGTSLLGSEAVTTFVTRSMAKGRSGEAAVIMWSVFKASALLGLAGYGLLGVFAFVGTEVVGLGATHRMALLVYGTMVVHQGVRYASLAVLRLTDHLARGFVVTVASSVVQVSGLVVAWLAGGSVAAAVSMLAGGMGLASAGLFVAAVGSARQMGLPVRQARVPLRSVPTSVADFLRGSFWQTKLGVLLDQLDMLLAGSLLAGGLATPFQVGLYGLARRLAEFPLSLAGPIALAVQTEGSKRWFRSDGEGFRRLALRLCATLTALALLACLGLLLLGEYVIVLFDPESRDAAVLLMLMLPGVFASVAPHGLFVLPLGLGRIKLSLIAPGAAMVVQVVAAVLLVPSYGVAGVAWARSATFVTLGAITVGFAVPLWRQSRRLPAPSRGAPAEAEAPPLPESAADAS